jgi:hypothetical protein
MGTVSRFTAKTISPAGTSASGVDAPLRCVVATTETDFASLTDTWDRVRTGGRERSPTISWSWLWTWWQVFGQGTYSPYVVTVFEGDVPVAVFPFVEPSGRRAPLTVRRLRQMGYHGELDEASLTEEPLAVVATGFERRAWCEVAHHLAQQLRAGRWDCATIRMSIDAAETPLKRYQRGVIVTGKSKDGPLLADLPPTWEALRKGLSKSMRDNLVYYPRLLTRDGHSFEVTLHSEPQAVKLAADQLIALHRRRALEDPSGRHDNHIPGEAQAKMLREALVRMSENGSAFVATLTVDGEVVAAQAFLQSDGGRGGGQLLMHYSGFAQSHSRYSPLLVLQSEVLKYSIARGITEMNVLFGEAQWQKRWNAAPRQPVGQCRLASMRPVSLLRGGLYALRRDLASRTRRRKLALPTASIRQTLSTLPGGFYELHLNLARFAASPMAHHLARVHR